MQQLLKPIGRQIKHVKYSVLDTIDYLLGRQDEMIPPRRLVANIGGGDFKQIGKEFLTYFVDLGGLKPHERVLEVGSGVGRMAVSLTSYLDQKGSYEGMDIVPETIGWCKTHITPKHPNFAFHVVDVYNKKYNPNGTSIPSEYMFPFKDESFDFVFLTSVFTHMLPRDMERYLAEISRVLKVGKRCLITFFLLNTESKRLIETKVSPHEFRFRLDGCWVKNKEVPEREIAFEEEDIRNLYQKHRLAITEPIRYGSWSGRPNYLSYQDIVVATRTT